MHKGSEVGRVVESVIVSPEKLQTMGYEVTDGPTAWWVMVKVDDQTFAKVKAGDLSMFSIQGRAERIPV